MRRFKFRLQSILNIKGKNLENERLKLAGILSVLDAQSGVLNEMNDKKSTTQEELQNLCQSSILDIQTQCCYRNYLNQIVQDIKMQIDIIEKTKQELKDQQNVVNEAYKEVKVLEKLKEKQFANYTFEFEQSQIKEADDITISRYARAI